MRVNRKRKAYNFEIRAILDNTTYALRADVLTLRGIASFVCNIAYIKNVSRHQVEQK